MKRIDAILISRKRVPKRVKSASIVLLSAMLLTVMLPGAEADMGSAKSETVYAVLGNEGSYKGATVVNCFPDGGSITDYGAYASVENLSGSETPAIEGDKIVWAAPAGSPFYYQGETGRALPVSINIHYALDGREIAAKDIAGKTGELAIEMTVRNETGTGELYEDTERELITPFAVQISLSLDNAMYTVKSLPDNASSVTAGSTITVSYASFPLPEDTFSFTLEGKDMELEPIGIVALPKAPPNLDTYGDFIDMDSMTQGAEDMISGADDMEQGVNDLLSALRKMRDAAKTLQEGLDDMADGTDDMADGAGAIYDSARTLKTKAAEYYAGVAQLVTNFQLFDAGMAQLQQSVADMAAVLSGLNDGAAQVAQGVSGLDVGIDDLSAANSTLAALAAALAARYPADTDALTLAGGLADQQDGIEELAGNSESLKTLSGGLSAGMNTFYTEFSTTFYGSVAALRQSSAQLYAASLQLNDGAYQISSACAQLSSALGSLSDGADDLTDGAAKAAAGVPDLIDALDEMIDGVEDLKDGMATLNEDGLKELKGTLEGLEGYLSALSDNAKGYTSFMDARNGGSVQFVLKTEGISLE